MEEINKPVNPINKYPEPPFKKQSQYPPGLEKGLDPQADHGENSYKGNGLLQGKKALITGADSGIGKAIAIAFAREGADVLISYLNEDEDAIDTKNWVEAAGANAILMPGDIRDERHCQLLISRAVEEWGGIDILVNNAAYQRTYKDFDSIPADEWREVFDTNVHAMFYLCHEALPYMPGGSSIINTTSVNAYHPNPILLPYAATKAAIQNFTANMAQMMLEADKGIRVNAVAPGPVWTPLITSTIPDHENFGKETPMGRPGQPAEIAPVFVFLASDAASYISGATIPATGGKIAF
ncbi:SDR family oxidoreductase [Sphingobacterium spiritivorum]|uniref:SDR family oxidoreductase n=1 Tax=Sphingobacterium spiritivorum TaxID=258 RepID=UPI003DA36E1E